MFDRRPLHEPYGSSQSKQPYARSAPSSPPPLSPPAKAPVEKGSQAVMGGSVLANTGGCERLGCWERWERWLLSKKIGGLINGTCGLGGPHYGEEQTARRISEISAYTLNSQTAYHARWYVPRSVGSGWSNLVGSLGYLCGV